MLKVFDRYGVPKGVAGVSDHGALTGLADNDHPQYSLTGHTHVAADIVSGLIALARLGTGTTGTGTKFLRDDATWAVPPGTGGGGGGNSYFPSGW